MKHRYVYRIEATSPKGISVEFGGRRDYLSQANANYRARELAKQGYTVAVYRTYPATWEKVPRQVFTKDNMGGVLEPGADYLEALL